MRRRFFLRNKIHNALDIKQWKHHHHYITLHSASRPKIYSFQEKTFYQKKNAFKANTPTDALFIVLLQCICVILCSIIWFPVMLNMLSDLRCLISVLSLLRHLLPFCKSSRRKKGSWRVRKGRPVRCKHVFFNFLSQFKLNDGVIFFCAMRWNIKL
jgi:hypothetical protein